ncbi:hypothetical protein [Hwanghaeella sp.]|uniref:hypothetical protein n=1 Tax=Hwanghaeella sp. TaxID=2605943 RepID=UPI003CCBC757
MTVRLFPIAAVVLVVLLCFPFFVFIGAAQAAQDPGDVAREIIADGPYQTELELAKPREPRIQSSDRSWWRDVFSALETLAPALRAILYIAGAAVIILILFAVLRGLSGQDWRFFRRRNRGDEQAGDEAGGVSTRTRHFDAVGTLSDADALAAAGRYSEAVRVLLFKSLEFLRSGIGDAVFPYLTSREILLVSGLDAAERDALRRIVATEEISHFGEALLNAEAYRACRGDFLLFSGQETNGVTGAEGAA